MTWALPLQGTSLHGAQSRALLMAAAIGPTAALAHALPGFLTPGGAMPLTNGGPNAWAIAAAIPGVAALPLTGLAMAITLGFVATLTATLLGRPIRDPLAAALLLALGVPALLPGSPLVDFAPALLIAIATIARREPDQPAILTLTAVALALAGLPTLGALATAAAITLLARPFLVSPANDNAPSLNPFRVYPA